jgi:hypothetical protein
MKNNELLKKISNGKVDHSQIQVHGCVQIIKPELCRADIADGIEEFDFNGTTISEVAKQLHDAEAFCPGDYFWKWYEGQDPDDCIIVVATPAGSTDFTDFARFVNWVRVFIDGDDDSNDAVGKPQLYECSKCAHVVLSCSKPEPIKWTDGHVCTFVISK